MKVDAIMSKSVVTVGMNDSIEKVKKIFDRTRFHHLLVVEFGKLVGVLSDRDLLKVLSPRIGTPAETTRDVATLRKRVHQVMTRKPITLLPDANISEAIEIFCKGEISCIPIADESGKPVGILSWRDVLKTAGILLARDD